MTIPQVPLTAFLTVSMPSPLLGGIVWGTQLIPHLDNFKAMLRGRHATDKKSGLALMPPEKITELLSFGDHRYLTLVGIASFLAVAIGVVYLVLSVAGIQFSDDLVVQVGHLLTWIGLLPALISYYCATRLYLYMVQLRHATET